MTKGAKTKTKWRFGEGQTSKQEKGEIRTAQAEGREEEYVAARRWQQMREAERDRKQARKAGRS